MSRARSLSATSQPRELGRLLLDLLDRGRDARRRAPRRVRSPVRNTTGLIDGDGLGKRVLLPLKCNQGDIALNAGGTANDIADDLNSITPFRSSYLIEFQDNDSPSKFRANISCMDFPPIHR